MDIKGLFLAAALFGFATGLAAQAPPVAGGALPSYFPPGIQRTTDPLKQREEILRTMMASWVCTQAAGSGIGFRLVAEPDSLAVQTDIVSTSSVTENPAKLKIILDHYLPLPDGTVRVTTLCGQRIITAAQAQADADDLKAVVLAAAQDDFDYYKATYDIAVRTRAAKLGIPVADLVAQLDEKVPGYNITFRELHHLPKPSRLSDFIPRELHLGYNTEISGILGVTWLNVGIIYYNPEARMLDWVAGRPAVMGHEMVHNNINIQKFPMEEAFDVEFMACLPEMLFAEDQLSLPDHDYLRELREIDEIYFNFDFKQMEKDVFKYDLAGNVVYDTAAYRYYYDQLQTIKKENLTFFQQVAIPEFYSDPLWWGAVNDIRGDKNSVFRMTMALHYNPTLLGGNQKTMEWLEAHRDEIADIAKQAFEAGMAVQRGPAVTGTVTPALVEQYHRMFTSAERERIEAYFAQHPEKLEELRRMPPAQALEFMGKFKAAGGPPR